MKEYVRFEADKKIRYGIVCGDDIREMEGSIEKGFRLKEHVWPLAAVRLLAPVTPGKIVGLGRNYCDPAHPELRGELPLPKVFLKSPEAMILSGEAVVKPVISERLKMETELAVVIGKKASAVSPEEAMQYVFGYMVINDVTSLDILAEDVLWGRAKNFDTFLPVGDRIVTDIDPSSLPLHGFINGQEVQSGNTNLMILDVPHIIARITECMTLRPGDMILTGTPFGGKPEFREGDILRVEVEGIGSIENPVVKQYDSRKHICAS